MAREPRAIRHIDRRASRGTLVLMDSYVLCVSCDCFIKQQEQACPFCGAAAKKSPSERPRPTTRMSRGQWVALGTTLAAFGPLGCSSPSAPASGSTEQQQQTGTDDAGQDADPDADPIDTTVDAIPCGATTCDRATQVCVSSDLHPTACQTIPPTCAGRGATCDCVASLLSSCACKSIAPGAIALTCYNGSNGCYGSPPARIRRRPARLWS